MKFIFLIAILFLSACVSNAPFRTGDGRVCAGQDSGCGPYYERNDGYDLGFVEYSERGNDFFPQQTMKVLENITDIVSPKDKSLGNGVAIVVFVHGWKHNASTDDPNVVSFKKTLKQISEAKNAKGVRLLGAKKVVGVYVGWRGMSFHGLQMENLTFWDRKATAEEVGRGGVTELLLSLEHISKSKPNNLMLTVGHSFGGAIALSALHDVLLYKMKAAELGEPLVAFGDGVILLNPAIEANQGLLLKESSMRLGAMGRDLPTLMYVISSRADKPTNKFFVWGQFFGVTLNWSQKHLGREYYGRKYSLSERELDENTIGNYPFFTTARMEDRDSEQPFVKLMSLPSPADNSGLDAAMERVLSIRRAQNLGMWKINSYCETGQWSDERLPCFENDPVDFLSVPKTFIESHNDVFNNNVTAFLTAAVRKSLWDRSDKKDPTGYCFVDGKFSLEKCFTYYRESYEIKQVMEVLNTVPVTP